ncbi:MAG: AbrB family transcriptional regulator [Clostridia bacterium]|nr:AbrB family transcriptional regulator [Clostridia bacterium]
MKSTGMIRAVDKMGRVVIPKEIREHLDIKNDIDSFEIYMEGDSVILRKYQPTCIFCNNLADSVELGGHTVCKDCIERLNKLKELSEEE